LAKMQILNAKFYQIDMAFNCPQFVYICP